MPDLAQVSVGDSASIFVYVHDDKDLRRYLDLFRDIGFKETDWTILTRDGSEDEVSYGPCTSKFSVHKGESND